MDYLLNQITRIELSALDYFFIIVSVCSFLLLLRRWARVKELKTDSAINHMVNFLLGMAMCFGVVGFLGLHAGSIYEAIDGNTFLGKNGSLGDEGFIGLLAFVIGVPVALAGSVYAVLLSYQSMMLSERSIEYARKERRDKQLEEWNTEVNEITTNFIGLSNSLQQMNVFASSDLDNLYNKLSELGSMQNESNYKEALKSIEKLDSTNDLRESFLQVLNAVRRIHAHQSSCQLLENMIAIRSEPYNTTIVSQIEANISHPKRLVAAQVLELDKDNNIFKNPAQRVWLNYASPEVLEDGRVDALMDCLSILHVQSHRVTPKDMLRDYLLGSTDRAVNEMRQGNEFAIPENGDFKKIFFFDWCAQTARQKNPEYFISNWLRMMLDMRVTPDGAVCIGVKKIKNLALADIVVADLHHLVPARSEVQAFLKRRVRQDSTEFDTKDPWLKQDFKPNDFVEEIGFDTLDARITNIEYPTNAPISSLSKDWLTTKDCKDIPLEKCLLFRVNNDNDSNKLLRALLQNADIFNKQWVEIVKSHAKRVLEEDLWEWKSLANGGIDKAIASIKSSRNLALSGSESDDFALLWWLMKARFSLLLKDQPSADGVNKTDKEIEEACEEAKEAYKQAVKIQTKIGIATPESRIGLLIEACFVDASIDIIDEVSKLDEELDWVETLRCWYEGYVWFNKCIIIDGIALTIEELSAKDGVFPMVLWHLRSKINIDLVFRWDAEAIVSVVTHPIRAKKLPFAPKDIRDLINSIHNELPCEINTDNPLQIRYFVNMDQLFKSWKTALASKQVRVLPPFSK